MSGYRTAERAAAEDVFFGQVVSNWARWFIIGAGGLLILWESDSTLRLMIGILPIVGLMVLNFYLHGRYLAGRPANEKLIVLATAADIALVTALVLLWPAWTSPGNGLFVLYYPVLIALAFIMRPWISIPFTLFTVAAYAVTEVVLYPDILTSPTLAESLVARLITLLALGLLGAYFWRAQRRGQTEAGVDADRAG